MEIFIRKRSEENYTSVLPIILNKRRSHFLTSFCHVCMNIDKEIVLKSTVMFLVGTNNEKLCSATSLGKLFSLSAFNLWVQQSAW